MHPFESTQDRSVFDDILVGCQQYLEIPRADFALQTSSLQWVALVGDHLDSGSPLGKLTGPICHGREGDDDEVRAALLLALDEEGDEGNGLDGLSETLQTKSKLYYQYPLHHGEKGAKRTISSAKIPFSLLLYKLTIHCKPLS